MTAGPGTTASYGWRIGDIRGIPVYLGRSWPVIAIIVVVTFAPNVSTSTGEYGGVFGYAVAVAYAVLLLLSVLAHEAGHALVARRFGFRVDRVVADLWGGHTVYDSSTSRAGTSAVISVSGPLANLALAGIGYAVMQALDPDGVVGLLLFAVTLTNAFVGVFNLLPGLPLDGGYLVHALVWKVTGDRNRALIVAGWLGRVVTVVFVLWLVGRPLLLGQPPSLGHHRLVRPDRGVPLDGSDERHPRGRVSAGHRAGAVGAGAAPGHGRRGRGIRGLGTGPSGRCGVG